MKKIPYYLTALAFSLGILGSFASDFVLVAPYGIDPDFQICVECTLSPNQIGCGEGGSTACTCTIESYTVTAYGSRLGTACASVLTRQL